MAIKTPITVAYGVGIGPEIMSATLKILSRSFLFVGTHGARDKFASKIEVAIAPKIIITIVQNQKNIL